MKSEKEDTVHSARFLRQRNFFMVVPVFVLPFLTLLLWTFGVVGEVDAQHGEATLRTGLNLTLPIAAPAKDSTWNKMKYYEQADRDSAKLRSYLKSDPYRKLELEVKEEESTIDSIEVIAGTKGIKRTRYDPYPAEKIKDENERKVFRKLDALNRELERSNQEKNLMTDKNSSQNDATAAISPDVEKLEAMMQTMQTEPAENKELTQLNHMLDKIMQIQNPENNIWEDSLQKASVKNKREVFTVHSPREDIISVLESTDTIRNFLKDSLPAEVLSAIEVNRFYSLEDQEADMLSGQAIEAIIPEDQALVSGATVKIRIPGEMYIGGIRIPADQFVYGVTTLNGERLAIKINSIVFNNHLLPVSLTVYDADGIAGIHVPGAITRDVAKRSAAQSVQGLGTIGNLDPSLGAQVATAGLQAAQNLIGKSAKLIRVHLRAGYRVLLKDDNIKEK